MRVIRYVRWVILLLFILIGVQASPTWRPLQAQGPTATTLSLPLVARNYIGAPIIYPYTFDIFKVNSTGGAPVQLTFVTGDDSQPNWSPDHQKIAFTSLRDNVFGEIYVMNGDGSNQVRL